VLIFFHRCNIFYAQWHHFSDVTNCVTFYEHDDVKGRTQVFDKMFESGKGLECFPNDVRISPEKVENVL